MLELIKDFELFTSFSSVLMIVVLPLAISFLISGYIGLERQNIGKAAGVSAHVLVAIASTGIAILQRVIFDMQLDMAVAGVGSRPEAQRLIAQVIAGVGFIGAGVILKDPKHMIQGITTASTIWSTAIIGIILGSGYIFIGTVVGLFLVIFMTIRNLRRGINPFAKHEDARRHQIKREMYDE